MSENIKKYNYFISSELLKKLRSLTYIILYHAVGVKKYFFTFFGCFRVLYLIQTIQSEAFRQLFANYIPFFDPRMMM